MPEWIKKIIDFLFSLVAWLGIEKPNIGEYIIYIVITLYESYKPTKLTMDLPANIFTAGGVFIVATMFSKFVDGVSALAQKLTGSDAGGSDISSGKLNTMLNQAASKLNSSGFMGMIKAGSGYAFLATPNYLNNKAQELSKNIALREMDPAKKGRFSTFATNAMKLEQKLLSKSSQLIGGNLVSKIYNTNKDFESTELTEDIKIDRQKMVNQELSNLVGKNKKYNSTDEISFEERKQILEKIDANISSKIAQSKIEELSKKGEISDMLKQSIHNEAVENVKKSYTTTVYRRDLHSIPFNLKESFNTYQENKMSANDPVGYQAKNLFQKGVQNIKDFGHNLDHASTTPELKFKKRNNIKKINNKIKGFE